MTDSTDALLVARAKGLHGRSAYEQAWSEIVSRYSRLMEQIAYNIVRLQHVACEIVQQTFLNALLHIRTFEPLNLRAWLTRITRNLALNHARDKKLRGNLMLTSANEPTVESNTERRIWEKQLGQVLDRAMRENLTPEQCRLLKLTVEELSYQEIAMDGSVPIGTVMSRKHRARNTMRRVVSDYLTSNDF